MNLRTLIIIGVLVVLLAGGGTVAIVKTSNSEAAKLGKLLPHVRARLERVRAALAARGIQTFVGQTLRTPEYQETRVASGNSATSKSWHLAFPDPLGGPDGARALDMYPIDPATGKPDLDGKRVDLFKAMHDAGAVEGFQNLAFTADGSKRYITTNKGKIWDGGHMEYREGLSWDAAKAVKRRATA